MDGDAHQCRTRSLSARKRSPSSVKGGIARAPGSRNCWGQEVDFLKIILHNSHGGHRIFENAFPFAEHEIGGDQHRFAFIALGQERKEHLHFVAIVLNVANIIEDDTGIFVQLGQLLGQAQVPFGGEEPLHERAC